MRHLFSILIAVLFISCENSPVVKSVNLDQEFSLRPGDSGIIKDLQLSLKVESIDDSRCPVDFQCIWQGSADVVISFESENTGLVIDTLHSFNKPVIDIADFSVSLIEVTPFPNGGGKAKNKKARILIAQN
jgi:hypothetical protein